MDESAEKLFAFCSGTERGEVEHHADGGLQDGLAIAARLGEQAVPAVASADFLQRHEQHEPQVQLRGT